MATTPTTCKACATCAETKLVSDFHKRSNRPDGYHFRCKDCEKASRQRRATERASIPPAVSEKTCRKCGIMKPLSEMVRNPNFPDGYTNQCHLCRSQYRKECRKDPVKLAAEREGRRRQARANPERTKEISKRSREKNRENVRAQKKDYHIRNRTSILARTAAKNSANPEPNRERVKRWMAENPEKWRAGMKRQKARRRAYENNSEGSFTRQEWEALCEKYNHTCLCCGKTGEMTLDHVVAIARGGTNYITNIQPLCLSCNSRKGTKNIDYRPVAVK